MELKADNETIPHTLQILRLEMIMGSDKHHAVLTQSSALKKIKNFKSYNPHHDSLESVHINSICYVVPTYVPLFRPLNSTRYFFQFFFYFSAFILPPRIVCAINLCS